MSKMLLNRGYLSYVQISLVLSKVQIHILFKNQTLQAIDSKAV